MSIEELPGPQPVERLSTGWWLYRGTGRPANDFTLRESLPEPPPWRSFNGGPVIPCPPEDEAEFIHRLGRSMDAPPSSPDPVECTAINAALFLRRPLIVTGRPGVGKSSLAYRVSQELRLGPILRWPINSRTTLRDGLYDFDAVGRVHDAAHARAESAGTGPARTEGAEELSIGEYLQLGPLGTAFLPYEQPRVLLIDELDKSDLDLPNDLLDVLEEGEYRIRELYRIRGRRPRVSVHTADARMTATIENGIVRCRAFPFIVITSNEEREFPPAFMRRCVHLSMRDPDTGRLANMLTAHLPESASAHGPELVREFLEYRSVRPMAADQLLNAAFLALRVEHADKATWDQVLKIVYQRIGPAGEE